MTRKATSTSKLLPAELTPNQIIRGIEKIGKRISELELLLQQSDLEILDRGVASLSRKIEETLSQIFGANTNEYHRYKVHGLFPRAGEMTRYDDPDDYIDEHRTAIRAGVATLITAAEMLGERLEDTGASPAGRARRAIDGLDLHRDIEEAAGQLYRDGHYSNAVLAAANALTALVKYRSGYTQDGVDLMNSVFSPNKPVLRFNDLQDESDKNEQKGFMMLFGGAVTALRNPRAHKQIVDDPEEAVEFIAFISLLAKRVDKAKKVT